MSLNTRLMYGDIKKGEKVDYAILKDGKPIFLIECKDVNVAPKPGTSFSTDTLLYGDTGCSISPS